MHIVDSIQEIIDKYKTKVVLFEKLALGAKGEAFKNYTSKHFIYKEIVEELEKAIKNRS